MRNLLHGRQLLLWDDAGSCTVPRQVVPEPEGREKVAVGRVALKDGHDPWRWPVPQDAPALLRKWYGYDWQSAKCDWGTGAGRCY